MRPRLDLTGGRYGRLFVEAMEYPDKGESIALCICDCGTRVAAKAHRIKDGHKQSCGCINVDRACEIGKIASEALRIDETGKRFGRLLVTGYVGVGRYKCLCDCGTEKFIRVDALRRGRTRSCGCMVSEKIGVGLESKRLLPGARYSCSRCGVVADGASFYWRYKKEGLRRGGECKTCVHRWQTDLSDPYVRMLLKRSGFVDAPEAAIAAYRLKMRINRECKRQRKEQA